MKIIKTKDVSSHKFNDDYTCLLIQFEDTDTNYFQYKKNWLPRDFEIILLIKEMMSISPTFEIRLKALLGMSPENYSKVLCDWCGAHAVCPNCKKYVWEIREKSNLSP